MENDYKWFFASAYVVSILLANFVVSYFGLVKFAGLVFPAGAIFIGLTFSLRDFVQRYFGHGVWFFMIGSTLLTAIVSPLLSHLPIPPWKVALASGVAFLASEAIDWFVYTVWKRTFEFRIVVSNLFAIPIDSILFVGIAFGSFSFLAPPVWGQSIVKYFFGLLVIPFLIWYRRKKGIVYS